MMSNNIDGIDYGPLFQLIGRWSGNKGLDVAPDAAANPDKSAYSDELIVTPSGPAENAEEQQLVSVKYHHLVRKKATGRIFHDQIGHWIYEASTGLIMHSLTIPRGVCILAGGSIRKDEQGTHFEVSANTDNKDFGILQSPFMKSKARTDSFNMTLTVNENSLSYVERMWLDIYGKKFEHIDKSLLHKVLYETE